MGDFEYKYLKSKKGEVKMLKAEESTEPIFHEDKDYNKFQYERLDSKPPGIFSVNFLIL